MEQNFIHTHRKNDKDFQILLDLYIAFIYGDKYTVL